MGLVNIQEYALEKNYNRYSKFKTVEEFNNNFEQAMYYHKGLFTKSEYVALIKLSKFAYSQKSKNTIGVAWSRGQIVVAATHKDSLFGISRATFNRMLNKAKKLNLITVINQYDENKYQKHNVYVFNKFDELTPEKFEIVSKTSTIDAPESVKIDKPITIFLELPRLKDIYNTYSPGENVDVNNNVDNHSQKELKEPEKPEKPEKPKTDYQRVSAKIHGLFKERSMTYRIFGVWLGQISKLRKKPSIQLAIDSLHILICEIKRRNALDLQPLRNPVGFFSGILKNVIEKWNDEQFEIESIELFKQAEAIKNNNSVII